MSKRRPRWQPPIPAATVRKPIPVECAWGSCRNPRYDAHIPICPSHIEVAHVIFERETDPERAESRYWVTPNWARDPDRKPLPEKKKPPTEGVIYYIRSGGHIKIGWTSDLAKRMRAYPPDTTLLAVEPGTRKDENRTHKRFAHLLTHGREWFPLAPQILEHIDRVKAEHGEPPQVDFSAKRATRIVGPRLHNYVGGQRGKLPTRTVRG